MTFLAIDPREGMIGLQNHDDNSKVAFRNIRVMPINNETIYESLADYFAVSEERESIDVLMLTTTHGFRHGPAIEASQEVMTALSSTTGVKCRYYRRSLRIDPGKPR